MYVYVNSGLHSPATKQSHSALDVMYELLEIQKQKDQFHDNFSQSSGQDNVNNDDDDDNDKTGVPTNGLDTSIEQDGKGTHSNPVPQQPLPPSRGVGDSLTREDDSSSANFESVPEDAERTVTEVISSYQLDKVTMKIDAMMSEVIDYRNAGLFTKAMITCQEATDITISHYGEANPAVAICLQHEASIYEDMCHYTAAIEKLQGALKILTCTYGPLAPPHEDMSPMHELKAIKERLYASSNNLASWFDTIDVDGNSYETPDYDHEYIHHMCI